MDRELTPDEIAELLPAYALDAVDDDERAAIDTYLESHPDARNGVSQLQVAASMLAHAGGPPPGGVWEQLESIISTTPPPLDAPPSLLTPRSPQVATASGPERRWRWLAAAAAVVALAFGGLWLAGRSGGDAIVDTAALARNAASEPGARRAVLTDTDGRTLATAVLTRGGEGYLTSALPPAAVGETYQLWGVTRAGAISLGVLGRDPGTVAFNAAVPTTSLAITTEVAGGVPVSEKPPDAVGDLVT